MLTFDIAGDQINGARDYQEDAFLTTHLGDSSEGGSLVIVADGMGGHAAGNVASNMAVQTFNKHVTSNFPSDALPTVLEDAVKQANGSITETVRETAALKGMGCTLVGVVLVKNHMYWVSVGDSHLYLARNNELKKKNADHSYGGFLDRMAADGNPIEPEAGFSRNMLMSALTGDEIAEIDCPATPLELEAGDRIIVSSDGLDTLSHGKIIAFAQESPTAKECVEALLGGVTNAKMPRQDNTTVVVMDVVEAARQARETETPAAFAVDDQRGKEQNWRDAGAPAEPDFEEDKGGKTGAGALIAVLLAVVLVGGGAGYWFVSRGSAVKPAPEIAVTHTAPAPLPGTTDAAPETVDVPDEETAPPVAVVEPAPTPVDTAHANDGTTFRDGLKSGGEGPEMVWLPAGSFVMGGRSGTSFEELPQHTVTVSRFAVSTHEITFAEYARFARRTGRKMPKSEGLDEKNYPVFYVAWNDALDYAKWLTGQTGKAYRIPSEAQWEYAARGGSAANYWWGGDLGSDNAHCVACETGLDPRRPTRVGRFKANAFGVYDTAGNLQEWVYDCWHETYRGAPTDGSVFEGGDCASRVVRGGAYTGGPKSLRSSARDKFQYDGSNDTIGIRVVRLP